MFPPIVQDWNFELEVDLMSLVDGEPSQQDDVLVMSSSSLGLLTLQCHQPWAGKSPNSMVIDMGKSSDSMVDFPLSGHVGLKMTKLWVPLVESQW